MATQLKFTLDWNCVIEVEECRADAPTIIELVDHHRAGAAEVALLAASASENAKSKRFPGNSRLFQDRISLLGWSDLPLVPMPAIIGLSYIDFCYIVGDGDDFERKMDALWQVIAPNVNRHAVSYLKEGEKLTDDAIQSVELSRWRNTWCDVVSAYSHIAAGRDVFVTKNTKDFQRNAHKLARLGMEKICKPKEALALLS
ncbi:hypothetical protein XM53_18385 [Roseovarius atlanticus]|uniref:PIN domain-containing protein n=1 Tax=Roseovarius atlanticus TaxID=1641875 RepID=A0A0T5NQ10_9RHOB|nr:hypothetical protein [Roseovarius atlanticus]KRS11048.1 hypothetical protein XM53_18385 [Roseovarius atlanticus]